MGDAAVTQSVLLLMGRSSSALLSEISGEVGGWPGDVRELRTATTVLCI